MRNSIAKNYLTKLLCAFLTLCLMLTAALALSARGADDDAEENREFSERILTEQFSASSGWPASPSSWTGEYVGQNNGSVVSGIIPLDSNYTANYDLFKLKNPNYPEYADKNNIPKTPFGGINTEYTGTTRNVLMINTDGSKTAYGYSYSDTSLSANSYYRFSVYVKTGMFAQASGAAVTLTGLKDPVGIWNIDTVSRYPRDEKGAPILPNNNKSLFGWEEFKIYVATGPNSESAALKLSVGDHVDEHVYPSEGYAFFANITADKLSATNYFADIEYIMDDDNVCIYDMNPVLNSNFKNGGFDPDPAIGGWKKAISEDEEEDTNAMTWGYYNAGSKFIDNNTFGMKKDPFTPTGKFDEDNCIMVLSSFYKVKDEDTNEFKSVKAGIVSDPFVINQEKFYMLAFWYNTEAITGGAAAVIKGESTVHSQQYKLTPVSIDNLTTDNNNDRYGWQRGNFYIRGSLIMDVKLTLELWLGYESEASGIAMFDDVTLTEIDYFEFTENKLGGQVVTIDSYAPAGTIANSVFSEVEYEKDEDGIKAAPLTYPAKPSSWTFINTQTAGTAGYSNSLVEIDEDSTAHGVVPTEEKHYNANRENYLNRANPAPVTTYANKNVLMLAADKPTAFGYRSGSFTVNTSEQYELKVNLNVKITSGYGASLILKKDSSIVATIEGIKDTDGFCDYTFYLAGGSAQATLTLEIWLGMVNKRDKGFITSTGHIFVNSVNLDSVFPEEGGVSIVEEKSKEFINVNFNPTDSRFSMYCPGTLDFSTYDRYTDRDRYPDADHYIDDPIRDAYDMNLSDKTGIARAGMLGFMPQNQVEVADWQKIYAAHIKTEYRTNTLLYMHNSTAGYSKFQSNYAINLNSDTRYRIDFSILVDLYGAEDNNRGVGAGIWLDGSHAFKNIRSTYRTPYTIADYDADGNPVYQKELEFKQFSFYYATGDTTESLNWYLTLGGTEYTYQHMAGRLFVNSVVVTEIDSYAFEEIEKEQNELEEDEKDPQILVFNNGTTEPVEAPADDDTDTVDTTTTTTKANEMPWYLIPSILLVVAMVIALGGVSIKRLRARSPGRRGRQKVLSYDRRKTLNIMDDAPESTEGETSYISGDSTFDSFDDETAVIVEKKTKPVKTVKPDDETVEGEDVEAVEGETAEVETEAVAESEESVTPEVKEENEFDD